MSRFAIHNPYFIVVVCLIIAVLCSPKYKGLYEVAGVAIVLGVIIGGWVAVVMNNPLY